MEELIKPIADVLNIEVNQVTNTLKLLEEGNTVPFIARYRKEMTHGLDEEQILYIQKEYEYQCNLQKRKEDVLRIIETQGKLTEEIIKEVNACKKLSEVEDIYRPYQQKRKTRATEAVRKGLKPLADWILTLPNKGNIENEASKYINDEVNSVDDALNGAKDIIAEIISDDAKIRWKIKDSLMNYGKIITKAKKDHNDEKGVYKMYYEHKERLSFLEPHRIMAIARAENEKVISVAYEYDKEWLIAFATRKLTKNHPSIVEDIIKEAVSDGLKRLAFPSVEREVWNEKEEMAKERSIEVFSLNLEKLLLQPPMVGKIVLGFDPAYRTGCKLAVLDTTGKLLKIDKIFPHQPVNKKQEAEKTMLNLIKTYGIEIIAIGNGTASRESESFVAELIRKYKLDVQYTIVSEAGASVYSASELARNEFPDLHVEERSAVSIGRRIQDPLSELIKIDPKSIGVGQYQHDLPLKQLNERLDFAILKTVNRVGVDLNTASKELLVHISGLTKATAESIVKYRNETGRFNSRQELKNVKRLGPKAIEQAAGFLRVNDGSEPLDKTSIHPESYYVAKYILDKTNNLELGSNELRLAIKQLNLDAICKELKVDEYTLNDIIEALSSPLRDYREKYDGPMLRSDVLEINDLHVGDKLEGVVRNVVDFGAFVDIGLHEDGLVHKSKMTKEKLSHPSEKLTVGDIVEVWVYNIDKEREKVQLCLSEDFL